MRRTWRLLGRGGSFFIDRRRGFCRIPPAPPEFSTAVFSQLIAALGFLSSSLRPPFSFLPTCCWLETPSRVHRLLLGREVCKLVACGGAGGRGAGSGWRGLGAACCCWLQARRKCQEQLFLRWRRGPAGVARTASPRVWADSLARIMQGFLCETGLAPGRCVLFCWYGVGAPGVMQNAFGRAASRPWAPTLVFHYPTPPCDREIALRGSAMVVLSQ